MKKIIALAIFVLSSIFAWSQSDNRYEYVSITFWDHYIIISNPGEEQEFIDVKDELGKKAYDLTPLLSNVEAYEENGWEFISTVVNPNDRGAGSGVYTSFMRKTKE